jgi:hypothetical protein
MKKILLMALVLGLFILAGCTPKTENQTPTNTTSGDQTVAGKCTPGPVDLVNYGDKGKRLANCFVEYPGEPSRQDKSYYITDIILMRQIIFGLIWIICQLPIRKKVMK